jgi:iron complex transport system substrate-binding protein
LNAELSSAPNSAPSPSRIKDGLLFSGRFLNWGAGAPLRRNAGERRCLVLAWAPALRRSLAFAVLVACAPERAPDENTATAPIELTDDAGFVLRLDKPAQRIVSLVPSGTETLVALGAREQLVGRTRYDVDSSVASLPSVGGGIDPSVEAIVALKPDLVISWESDKRQLTRNALSRVGIPVFVLRTQDTSDVFNVIRQLGRIAGRDSQATAVAASIRATFDSVRASVAGAPVRRVLYVAEDQPPMTAGRRTFISELIRVAGGESIFDDLDQLWPNVSMEEIVRRDPDILVFPAGEISDPLARVRAQQGWRDLRAVREGRVVTVSADLLNRPSPSVAKSVRMLRDVLHPPVKR